LTVYWLILESTAGQQPQINTIFAIGSSE